MEQFDRHIRDTFSGYAPAMPDGAWERLLAKKERRKPRAIAWYMNRRNIRVAATAALLLGTGAYWLAVHDSYTKNNSINTSIAATSPQKKDNLALNNNNTKQEAGTTETASGAGTNNNNTGSTGTEAGQYKAAAHNDIIIPADSKKAKRQLKQYRFKAKYNTGLVAADAGDELKANNDNAADAIILQRQLSDAQKIAAALFKKDNGITLTKEGLPVTPCPQIEKDAAGNKSYFEFYAGPDYAIRRYDNSISPEFLQRRKEALSFHSAFSAGLRYTRVFNNGVSVRTGINYSRINEKFSFVQSNIVQTVYIIDAVSGDTTGSYTVTGKRYRTTYNNYHTVDIPLLFGYEMGNGRLHANISAGLMVNVRSWQRGETLDTAFMPVSITTGSGDKLYQYKTNMGFGFSAATSVYYRLTENMHLLAEPYIRYNLSPMNKNEFSIQERFTTIGMRLGLRFDLE
jgi:hypothetical protein